MARKLSPFAIAVYKPSTRGARGKAEKLIAEGRVNFIAPANYSESSEMDRFVKGIIRKVAADVALKQLGEKRLRVVLANGCTASEPPGGNDERF